MRLRCSTAGWPVATVTGWSSRAAEPADLVELLVSAGVRVTEIRPERRSLEDVVLSVTSAGSDRADREAPS